MKVIIYNSGAVLDDEMVTIVMFFISDSSCPIKEVSQCLEVGEIRDQFCVDTKECNLHAIQTVDLK